MERLWQDLHYAVRLLSKAPGFTLTAIVVIALGIGANSAIFSLVDVVLLRPLPYSHPEQLARLWERPPGFLQNSVSPVNFQDWRDQNQVFSGMAAVARAFGTLTANGADPERLPGQAVTIGFFDLLGVRPVAGRLFTSEDERAGSQVVMISERLWKTRFGRDAGLIGRQIILDGASHTVIGVAPANFQFMYESDLWTPFRLTRSPSDRRSHYLQVVARLKPGVTFQQARADMETVAAGIAVTSPDTNKDWSVTLMTLREATVRDDLRRTSLMLAGVSAFVLLMGCANVAGLLLARGVGRSREIAVRAALGVTRGRLLQQLLTESFLIAALGGLAGIILAWAIVRLAPAILPAGTLPVAMQVSLDARVIAFASVSTLLTGALFGLAPAWQAVKISLADTLRSGGRTATSGATFRTALAASEIAIAVMLMAGSGLLLRTVASLSNVDGGFRAENVLTMRLNTSFKRNSESGFAPFVRRVEEEVGRVPGVRSVGMGIDLPLDGWDIGEPFEVAGQPLEKSKRPSAHYQIVTTGWFDTLGIPVIAGRAFNDRDTAQSTPVCMVNEELVRQYFHGKNPSGERLRVAPFGLHLEIMDREIVGVVRQVKVLGLAEKTNAMEIYVPATQDNWAMPALAVRVQGNPLDALPAVKTALAGVDKNMPLTRIRSMEEVAAQSVTQPRFRASLVSVFAGLALVLAAVGIAGVLAFSVNQRTREFGIRMALGARSYDVLAMVLRRGLIIASAGVGTGLAGAIALTRFLDTLLFGVKPLDPVTFLTAAGMLIAVALAACAAPAIRAARTDPALALRSE